MSLHLATRSPLFSLDGHVTNGVTAKSVGELLPCGGRGSFSLFQTIGMRSTKSRPNGSTRLVRCGNIRSLAGIGRR